jgi:tripartite-type tricarboxylate transporter receptor subunit TctC
MRILRSSTRSLILICLVCQFAGNAWAQRYPAKAVRYLVADAAGSGSDTLGRIVAGGLAPVFGQQVVVDNRPGAAGTIGADVAAKAPADGYTVLQISSALAAGATLHRNLPFDLMRDFAAVTQLAASPQIVVVHPSLPVKSMNDLVKLAKARPDALVYGSAGSASSTHLAAELFKAHVGVNMLHVPYRGGGQALTAVLSGETSVYFAPIAAALPHVRAGRLRALAVTTAKRVPLMPELPTVAEAGAPGYETAQWYGLLVPLKTPKETIETLRDAAVSVLNSPAVNKRLNEAGYIVIGDKPEEFSAYLKSEIDRLGKIIRNLGLTAD